MRVSPDDIRLLTLAILVQHESWHGADTQIRCRFGQGVDVNLVELGLRVLLAELCDLGGDGLAGTAPAGEAVDDDGFLGVEDLLLVFGVAGLLLVFGLFVGMVREWEGKTYFLIWITPPWSAMVEYLRGMDWEEKIGCLLLMRVNAGVVLLAIRGVKGTESLLEKRAEAVEKVLAGTTVDGVEAV